MKPQFIIIHHSLTKDSQTVSWDAIRRYHTNELGWREIGYHFGIERVGKRYEIVCGRMMNDYGAHCKQMGMNAQSIGICFVGNFDNVAPPAEQWELGIKLVKTLMEVFGIHHENVQGHCEYATWKSCPGDRFSMELFRHHLVS